MCARVYISRSFLQLPPPVHGRVVDMAAPIARSGSAVHPPGEGAKEGPEVPSRWWPAQGQPPIAVPFPMRRQAWCRCRPEPGLQGRGAGVSQELPQSRGLCRGSRGGSAPGAVGDSGGESPGGGRSHACRRVGACPQPQPGLRVVGVFVFIEGLKCS